MGFTNQSEASSKITPHKWLTIVYLFLSATWFVITALLIIHTVDIEDKSSIFRGLGTAMLVMLSIVIGIPTLIFYIYNMGKSLERYSPATKSKKLMPFISSVIPMAYYCFFSHFVISRLYYLFFYGIAPLILLYVSFFLIIFSYIISVLFNLTRIWFERVKWINIMFMLLSVITVIFGLIPITHSKEIFDSRVKIGLEQLEKEYQKSILTYTYTDSIEENGVRIDLTIQLLSYAQSSDKFEASQHKNNMNQSIYITKKSTFITDDNNFIDNYIDEIINDTVKNDRAFAQISVYSYDFETYNGEIVAVIEYFNAWTYNLSGRDSSILFSLDERFTNLEDIININKKGLIEKQERGDCITFNGKTIQW